MALPVTGYTQIPWKIIVTANFKVNKGCGLCILTISTSDNDWAKRHHYIFDIWRLDRDVSDWPLRVHPPIKQCLIKAT